MLEHGPSFFEGLSADDVLQTLTRLDVRRFSAGATVIAEGETLHELYVIQSGTADVFITDREGTEHLANRVGSGATLGEMSLFTNRAASASVRAATDLEVLVLSEADCQRLFERFPRLYHNLGAIVSDRLVHSERRAVAQGPQNLTLLEDHDAPPLLGYALACSVAWHTQSPTLLVVATDGAPVRELEDMAGGASGASESAPASADDRSAQPQASGGRARIMHVNISQIPSADALSAMLQQLCDQFTHVLVQVPEGARAPLLTTAHRVKLTGSQRPAASLSDLLPGHVIEAWSAGTTTRPDSRGVLHVPPLEPRDQTALRAGILPNGTPTGGALGWLARNLTGLKVGLALGAGSVKGYAHIGVLRVFERIGLPVDYLSGTSVGAAVGFLHAAGHGLDESADILEQVGRTLFRPTIPVRSLLSSARLRAALKAVEQERRIEDLRLPLAVVAVDILTGREVVLRRGPAWRAVLASISIPGVYPPVRIGPHLLVDGGVLNPVPSNIAGEMGADIVVATKLGGRSEVPGAESRRAFPWVVQTIVRSVEIMQDKIGAETAGAAAVLIEPEFGRLTGLRLRDFSQSRRYIEVGEAAALKALPRLAAVFPWLRR